MYENICKSHDKKFEYSSKCTTGDNKRDHLMASCTVYQYAVYKHCKNYESKNVTFAAMLRKR